MDVDYSGIEDLQEPGELVFGNEINVKERCQQFGISLDNVRYRVGTDRFKWICLMCMLKLKNDIKMFSDDEIQHFFDRIIPRIPRIQNKNALACVMASYISIVPMDIRFVIDKTKLQYVTQDVISNQEFLFQQYGCVALDIVRYIRLFSDIFMQS